MMPLAPVYRAGRVPGVRLDVRGHVLVRVQGLAAWTGLTARCAAPENALGAARRRPSVCTVAAVLITGGSGSGKTTVAAELGRRGRLSIDADADESLARWVDRAGRVVCPPAASGLRWLARHRWEWDPVRLEEILTAAGRAGQTLYVCGNASNETGFFHRFDRVILLEIDEATMLRRLDEPSRGNDFGRVGETRALLRRWLPGYQARMRARGVAVVDATAALESVIESILALTEPAAPHHR